MRTAVKQVLTPLRGAQPASGLTILIYHRVGGGTPDERDVYTEAFAQQLEVLSQHRVLSLDAALDELAADDDRPKVVLTFDDGFMDIHDPVLPMLRPYGFPFVLYLATAYVGGQMHWEGSSASVGGPGLTWEQIEVLLASGLCTFGNHTHTHAPPLALTVDELERCSELIERKVGISPQHFAYPWGVRVPGIEPALRARFRSAVTGELGRNHPGDDPLRLRRVPVRRTDPIRFFDAKLRGRLVAERAYAGIVRTAKAVGFRA